MNKKGISVTTTIIVLLILTLGAAITAGNWKEDQTPLIKENLRSGLENITFDFNTTELSPELGTALSFYVTGLFRAYEHITYWAIDYTSENPEIPYKLLLFIFLLAIFAPVVLVLFKMLVIMFLLIKEFFQSRKEKKELRSYNENLDR